MIKPELAFVVLANERPQFLERTLQSIRRMKTPNNWEIHFYISDNSQSEKTNQSVVAKFPEFQYIKRASYAPDEHLNEVIANIKEEFFILFHDDDEVLSFFLDWPLQELIQNKSCIAVAANAHRIDAGKDTGRYFNENLKGIQALQKPEDIYQKYFSWSPSIQPFPSYFYRNRFREMPLVKKTGGKYSDVIFLADLVKLGPIIWNSEPSMRYHFHGQNGSFRQSIRDMKKLVNVVVKETSFGKKSTEVLIYRLKFHLLILRHRGLARGRLFSAKGRTVLKSLILLLVRRPHLVLSLLSRLKPKSF